MFKAVVIILLLAILASLGSGLFFLTNDKGGTKRTVNALTIRVTLSVALFALLFLAWWLGWIQPHGVGE
ncbi:MAG: twin transmembrane helix small protein [Pseudomonadota bacterium]